MSRGTKPVLTDSFAASGDLSANPNKFVLLNGSDQVALCSTLGEQCLGVQLDKPAAQGRGTTVALSGIHPVAYGTKSANIATSPTRTSQTSSVA